MRPARAEMRDVDLVEVDEIDDRLLLATGAAGTTDEGREGVPGQATPGGGRWSPRGLGRRSRRWAVVAGVAVAVVAGTGTVVSERREAARLAAVAQLPGVLRTIESPLVEVWGSDHRLWSPLSRVGGLLVGVSDVWDGSRDIVVVGLEAATGEEVWSTTVVRSVSSPIGGVRCVVPDARPGADATDRLVVCLSIDELGPSPQDMSELEPRRARMLVLAAGTGEVLQERTVDPSTSIAPLGADIVVKELTADSRTRVTRTDPWGRLARWTFTGPVPRVRPEYTFVRTDDDVVVAPGQVGWALSADGEVLHSWEADRPAAAGWADVVRGRVLVQPMRDIFGSIRVVDLRSGRSFDADGYALSPTVDDGSTGDLILVQSAQGEGLAAREVGSGRAHWSIEGEDEGGALILDGRVVRAGDEGLQAVDAVTGQPLWESPAVRTRQYGLFSDGRLVVRTERDPELGTVLVARGLDDGRVRWSTDVTDELEHLVEVEGELYGLTGEGMVAFGPAAGDRGAPGTDPEPERTATDARAQVVSVPGPARR